MIWMILGFVSVVLFMVYQLLALRYDCYHCVLDDEAMPFRGSHITKTGHHDAGAVARCSYCRRYSDNNKALQYDPYHESPKDLKCDCGKTHGWCGSFERPTSESIWSS